MKSKYKKVLFSLLAFDGNIRYNIRYISSPKFLLCFFKFLFLCSTIYMYINNLLYTINSKYKENHQAP